MSAEEAVEHGVCTVLASDYYYPSLFHAAEHLVRRGVVTMKQAWDLISCNPAQAMRLQDRGRIEVGNRADLVVVDLSGAWQLKRTIAGGRVIGLDA